METPREWIDAGAWVGRQQAFAMIANKCSAAQALCLKQVRETRLYEKLELTWEEFCKEYAGISREQADRLIRQHEEFGDAYFRLSEIARISPETYRQIASQVSDEGLEFDGRKLALIPENGAQDPRRHSNAARAIEAGPRCQPADLTRHHPVGDSPGRADGRSLDDGPAASSTPASAPGSRDWLAYAVNKWTHLARTVQDGPTQGRA